MAIDLMTPVRINYSKQAAEAVARGKNAMNVAQGTLVEKAPYSDEFLKAKAQEISKEFMANKSARQIAVENSSKNITVTAKNTQKFLNKKLAAVVSAGIVALAGIGGALLYKSKKVSSEQEKA